MANYRLKLTDRLSNLASQGGLDPTVNNVTSMQRDGWIDVYNGNDHRKIIVSDQGEFSNEIDQWSDHHFIYNPCANGAALVESFPLTDIMDNVVYGCLEGIASQEEGVVRLTNNTGGSYGAVSYYGTLPTSFRVTFDFKYAGGGADATYFYWLADAIPQTESGEVSEDVWINGFILYFSEYSQRVRLHYVEGESTSHLATADVDIEEDYVPDEWHSVVIYVNAGTGAITMSINDVLLINHTDESYGSRPLHDKFGIAARDGGVSGSHYVRNLTIEEFSGE